MPDHWHVFSKRVGVDAYSLELEIVPQTGSIIPMLTKNEGELIADSFEFPDLLLTYCQAREHADELIEKDQKMSVHKIDYSVTFNRGGSVFVTTFCIEGIKIFDSCHYERSNASLAFGHKKNVFRLLDSQQKPLTRFPAPTNMEALGQVLAAYADVSQAAVSWHAVDDNTVVQAYQKTVAWTEPANEFPRFWARNMHDILKWLQDPHNPSCLDDLIQHLPGRPETITAAARALYVLGYLLADPVKTRALKLTVKGWRKKDHA